MKLLDVMQYASIQSRLVEPNDLEEAVTVAKVMHETPIGSALLPVPVKVCCTVISNFY